MKQIKKLAGILPVVLAIIACNGTAVQTVEVTRVVPQTVVVTEAVQAQVGGFTTGTPVDVTTLPALAAVGGGGEPSPCFTEGTEPSIDWGWGLDSPSLCLNNFPTAPDSPPFTVTLTDPAGRAFRESFIYSGKDILDSRGEKAGSVANGESIDGNPGTPGVSLELYIPASFSCGSWSISAGTQDGRITAGPTTLPIECPHPQISVVDALEIHPFLPSKAVFANGETLYVAGAAYPPATAITVALYQEDPAAGKPKTGYMIAAARYATSVMTDSAGNFQAPFLVDSQIQRGLYYVVAAPAVTADIYLNHFGARFNVK